MPQTHVIGTLQKPDPITNFGDLAAGSSGDGPLKFFNNVLNFAIVLAGVFTLVNFILSAYNYLSSNGEPQKITNAGNLFLKSIIGLAIVGSTFVIAGLIGLILYKNPTALIDFEIFKIN